jgi:hypothetical protein
VEAAAMSAMFPMQLQPTCTQLFQWRPPLALVCPQHSAEVLHRDLRPQNLLINIACELVVGSDPSSMLFRYRYRLPIDITTRTYTSTSVTPWHMHPSPIATMPKSTCDELE